jgi:hypothetical protein
MEMQGNSGLTGDVGGMNLEIKALDVGSTIYWMPDLAALRTGV